MVFKLRGEMSLLWTNFHYWHPYVDYIDHEGDAISYRIRRLHLTGSGVTSLTTSQFQTVRLEFGLLDCSCKVTDE